MAARRYNRLAKVESNKAKKSIYFYIVLTISIGLILFFFGLPLLIKISSLVYEAAGKDGAISLTDNTPPAPPRLDNLPEFTNSEDISVKGTAEPGTTVTIKFNGTAKEIVANASGEFTSKFTLHDGENVILALATDKAGNKSTDSDRATVVLDKEPPEIEITKPEEGHVYYGSKEKQISVDGQTDSENSVRINDRIIVVSASGSFTMPVTLGEGDNSFNIKVQDRAGNETEETITVKYYP